MLETPVNPAVLVSQSCEAVTNRLVRTISRKGSTSLDDTLSDLPENIGMYLAGFVDGEGSFNISFRPRPDYRFPWKISLCFNVSQRDESILRILQKSLGCGTMRQRQDGVWYFEVNDFGSIKARVIPFFKKFSFLSEKKKRDFQKFIDAALIVSEKRHLTYEGLVEIVQLRREMNDGGKRKYTDEQILSLFRESSEIIRQTLVNEG